VFILLIQKSLLSLYLNMIAMLKEADRSALKTFIGTGLIKLATGVIGLWGTINIYFFSYLKNKGTEITSLTNSIIMLCAIIPASLAVLISTRLSAIFGYKRVIRVCALIFALSPYLINLGLNEVTLGLFYLFIPITCFAISSIPILNCLWSQFPNDLNKISGLAVLFFALGMIVWNLIFLGLTNPHN
jgi:MFS family permease